MTGKYYTIRSDSQIIKTKDWADYRAEALLKKILSETDESKQLDILTEALRALERDCMPRDSIDF